MHLFLLALEHDNLLFSLLGTILTCWPGLCLRLQHFRLALIDAVRCLLRYQFLQTARDTLLLGVPLVANRVCRILASPLRWRILRDVIGRADTAPTCSVMGVEALLCGRL